MENLTYTDAVRIFSAYFTQRETDLSSINARTFSNGFLRTTNNDNNKKAYKFLFEKNGSPRELDLKNFLVFSYEVLNDYSNDKENFDNLHLSKENDSIFKFIKSLIDFKGTIKDCDALDSTQINQLKIDWLINELKRTLLDKFSSSDNLVQTTTINSVNEVLSHLQINLNANTNANTNANANTSGDRIDRVINNNKKDFKLIRKYVNKLLRYEGH